ncbi:hypothetical protein Syun_016501 [Stephania yunnanensis]|uniref:Uncharacterized protein n=1 Tax=Stephania yunnanensis TaxID=152371 RepID=A0AAP0P2I0_9MAGN
MAGTEETHVASMRNAGKSASVGQMSDDVAVDQDSPNVNVSAFDFSIENHFQMMDMIFELCQIGEKQESFDVVEMERMSSMITFIREWRQFCYKPRTIKFACETGPPHGKHVVEGVNFPQYSAASVPKMKNLSSDNEIFETGLFDGKDFVVYVGGPVWALDWCPTVLERSDSGKRCEYLAVSAHPPESSYHKIGAPLTGRGIVQVWCLLNTDVKNEESPLLKKQRGWPRKHTTTDISLGALDGGNHVVQEPAEPKKRGRPRKQTTTKESLGASDGGNQVVQELAEPKKRGRPRKQTTTKESLGALDGGNQVVQELAVQVINSDQECLSKQKGRPREHIATMVSLGTLDGGNQVIQELADQLINLDKERLPKQRGRPRKDIATKESIGTLDGENQVVQEFAAQVINSDQYRLPKQRGHPKSILAVRELWVL